MPTAYRVLIEDSLAAAPGLTADESQAVAALVREWRLRLPRNQLRDRYYLGHVPLKDIGVALPPAIRDKVDPRVGWARKAVTSLADRVRFDGFASDDEAVAEELRRVVDANDMRNLMRKATICELKHCCAFLTVTSGPRGPVVSAYPATAASARWDDERKRIRDGLVVVASEQIDGTDERWPYVVNVFTADDVITLRRDPRSREGDWGVERHPHRMGRPLMEPMAYAPTLERPFGSSRITRTVMSLVDEFQRAKAYATLAAAFAASPQKYLLGTDDDPISDNRWNAYIGSIVTFTMNSEGNAPQFGQLPQPSMQPHADYMRQLAAQFSGETNVPISSLGVVHDQASSAEALYAAKEDMVIDAANVIDDNRRALRNVALMALAVVHGTDFDTEATSGVTVDALFANPSRPSVVSQSDAMVKQISAIPWLAETDVALEQLGYSTEDIHRMQASRRRAEGMALLGAAATPRAESLHNLAAEAVPETVAEA